MGCEPRLFCQVRRDFRRGWMCNCGSGGTTATHSPCLPIWQNSREDATCWADSFGFWFSWLRPADGGVGSRWWAEGFLRWVPPAESRNDPPGTAKTSLLLEMNSYTARASAFYLGNRKAPNDCLPSPLEDGTSNFPYLRSCGSISPVYTHPQSGCSTDPSLPKQKPSRSLPSFLSCVSDLCLNWIAEG